MVTLADVMPPSSRPLVCLDIDGTILRHDASLSPAVRDAVQRVREHADVVLATGRSVIATAAVAEQLGIADGFGVCSNGAVTLRWQEAQESLGYELLDIITFDPAPVLAALREAHSTALIAVEVLGKGYKVSREFPDDELMGEQRVVSFEELVAEPTTRVSFRCTESTPEDFIALAEQVGMHGVNYNVGFTAWMDINPLGVSKASALERVRERLGVAPQLTLAVGDQRNDLEMLGWAARGVAMGQAPQEVLAAANEIAGSIDEDGLVAVLDSVPQWARAAADGSAA